MTIEIVDPGLLTSVQDPIGRPAWRRAGVPVGGAVDVWSARLANRLVGNADDRAVLEMTLHGATLRIDASAAIAVTGGLDATVDGLPLPPVAARMVRPGSLIRIASGGGARAYLAVAGGIDVAQVLGSRSTDLRGAFGGHEGRALRAGDRLPLGRPARPPARFTGRLPALSEAVRLVEGPHAAGLLSELAGRSWRVSDQADRIGVRLAENMPGGGETPSMGLTLGAVQLPPDGRPIVMLADRPVTGGYLVPAVAIRADVGRVAQLRPGDEVRFESVSPEEARAAWRQAEEELAALEPLDERKDSEPGWAGSHR